MDLHVFWDHLNGSDIFTNKGSPKRSSQYILNPWSTHHARSATRFDAPPSPGLRQGLAGAAGAAPRRARVCATLAGHGRLLGRARTQCTYACTRACASEASECALIMYVARVRITPRTMYVLGLVGWLVGWVGGWAGRHPPPRTGALAERGGARASSRGSRRPRGGSAGTLAPAGPRPAG